LLTCGKNPPLDKSDKMRIDSFAASMKNEVSNSDQLLIDAWAIIIVEAGTSALSFRSPELRQPSEVLPS
jgi:hypothetical protein